MKNFHLTKVRLLIFKVTSHILNLIYIPQIIKCESEMYYFHTVELEKSSTLSDCRK